MATSSKLLKNKQPLVKKPEPSEWPFRLVLASWILMQDEQLPLHPWLALSSLAFGGGERDRTDDPLLAKQVLSHLSYTPFGLTGGSGWARTTDPRLIKTVL